MCNIYYNITICNHRIRKIIIQMQPIILFRKSLAEENEFEICQEYFITHEQRSKVPYAHKVIGRYSVLPYYKELENDLKEINCSLINTYKQHKWIANFEWYDFLKQFTPESWTDHNISEASKNISFIVKGATNSKKHQWNTKCFAQNRIEALRIAGELKQDSLIGSQEIIYRKYIPLETYEIGINDIPFTNEWRFFFYEDKLVTYGYYWSIASKIPGKIENEGLRFAEYLAKYISSRNLATFYVLDIAKTEDGNWILIEINDGQCSGLSCCDTNVFYKNLKMITS